MIRAPQPQPTPPVEPKRLMSIPETADYLGAHRSTLRRWLDEGRFPVEPRNIAGRDLFSTYEIDEWLRKPTRRRRDL